MKLLYIMNSRYIYAFTYKKEYHDMQRKLYSWHEKYQHVSDQFDATVVPWLDTNGEVAVGEI